MSQLTPEELTELSARLADLQGGAGTGSALPPPVIPGGAGTSGTGTRTATVDFDPRNRPSDSSTWLEGEVRPWAGAPLTLRDGTRLEPGRRYKKQGDRYILVN